jgi:RNA polymerase sigma-70 factor (ECF subfamily)
VHHCLQRGQLGPYQLQAAIQAVHSTSPSSSATDWSRLLRLYDMLANISPSPVVALNRAVVLGEVEGPAAALRVVDGLTLGGYHVFHAVRADLLRRLDRVDEAMHEYREAARHAPGPGERSFLEARMLAL